ncbi:MAG: hypothetical protein H6925_00085 [Holosporaceae bacterium]|nr:MAG: hypothetical protein H6925_00085 [Holosporaceae bacterium]
MKKARCIRRLKHAIFWAVLHACLIKLATEMKISVAEKSFSCDDLYQADEAFSSSSNNVVVPITHADNKKLAQETWPYF